jgi:hypothetical protein
MAAKIIHYKNVIPDAGGDPESRVLLKLDSGFILRMPQNDGVGVIWDFRLYFQAAKNSCQWLPE